MARATTIKDIADKLGISPSTVSRILNGKNQRNKSLVAKVKRTAKQLNYHVNTTALALRTNKTRLIGIILPEISNDFFSGILSGIEEITEEQGYNLLICQSNESREKEERLIRSLLACNVEGVLVSLSKETRDTSFLSEVDEADKPAVLFDRVIENSGYPAVQFDDFTASYEAGRCLVKNSQGRFLYLGLSEDLKNDKDRLHGYNKALKDSGYEDCTAVYVGTESRTMEVLNQVWSKKKFDTVVCYHDVIAAEAITYFNTNNIKIPEEVAVCGFDNRAFCKYTVPTLTSIEHSSIKMGRLAAQQLLSMLRNEESVEGSLEAAIVLRESTRNTHE